MAGSVVRAANDENTMPQRQHTSTSNGSTRRVLGDVSANSRVHTPNAGIAGNKPMTGSPLKRSFTAAVESGQGFTYLKKRRFSGDEVLSQVDGPAESARMSANLSARSRSVPEPGMMQSDPTIYDLDLPSPTEPNTPSDNGESTQDSSDRKSFSSLINYDLSSQQSVHASQQTAQKQKSNLVFKTVSHAETLKLRLRVAMYKVQTNQVNVPFAQLRVEGEELPSNAQITSDAVEAAVASLRAEARAHMPPQPQTQTFPQLLPGPVLLPTAYSSRMLYNPPVPNSPPVTSPLKSGQQTRVSTPMSNASRLARAESADLTSSVVKGRVAEGLLGLRHAV